MSGVRLDKWLWAARFFKTRAKAKEAVDAGKVRLDGEALKPGREVKVGDVLTITRGMDLRTVVVRAALPHRKSAPLAAALYEETSESVLARERLEAQRKAQGTQGNPGRRPTKRDRRLIHRFRQGQGE